MNHVNVWVNKLNPEKQITDFLSVRNLHLAKKASYLPALFGITYHSVSSNIVFINMIVKCKTNTIFSIK